MKRFYLCLILATMASESRAQNKMQGRISLDGIQQLSNHALSYLPRDFTLPTFDVGEFGCFDFTQHSSELRIEYNTLNFQSVSGNKIRANLNFSAEVEGELDVGGGLGCFGVAYCTDRGTFENLRAEIEYHVVDSKRFEFHDIHLVAPVSSARFDINDCGIVDNIVEIGIGMIKESFVETLRIKVEEASKSTLVDFLGDLQESFVSEASIDALKFSPTMDTLNLNDDGLEFSGSLDISNPLPAHPCVQPFDVGTQNGQAQESGDLYNRTSDVEMTLSTQVINNVLYQFWREGFLCLEDESFAGIGIELDLGTIKGVLPGFSGSSDLSLKIVPQKPPTLFSVDNDKSAAFGIKDLSLIFTSIEESGEKHEIVFTVDAFFKSQLFVDAENNSVVAELQDATLERLMVSSEKEALQEGFEVSRIVDLANQILIPNLLRQQNAIRLTVPVFKFDDLLVGLDSLSIANDLLHIGTTLMKKPEFDSRAPDTFWESVPSQIVSLEDAVLRVQGEDDGAADEFLSYVVVVNGEFRGLQRSQTIRVGELGVTGEVTVEVATVDLHDNEDPTPSKATILVDGVFPQVAIAGSRVRLSDVIGSGSEFLTWEMSDDLTDARDLRVFVDVFQLTDPSNLLSSNHIESYEMPKGATQTQVFVQSGGLYRIEIEVTDEAGNRSKSSVLLEVPKEESLLGCSLADNNNNVPTGFGMIVLLLCVSLRRKQTH